MSFMIYMICDGLLACLVDSVLGVRSLGRLMLTHLLVSSMLDCLPINRVLVGCLAYWLAAGLPSWLFDWCVECLVVRLAGQLVGRLVGSFAGWMACFWP